MPFSVRTNGDTVVVAIEGTLMANNRGEFKELLLDAMARGGRLFRIDLSDTSYIDSSGLGVLVSVAKAVRKQGGEMRITNVNDELRTLFELTKLDTLVPVEGSEGEGLSGRAARRTPPPPTPGGHSEAPRREG